MSLVLEYRNTRADYLNHHKLVLGDSYRSARSAHYKSLAYWLGILLIGSYFALQADYIFPMCLMIAYGIWMSVRSIPYSSRYWTAIQQSLSTQPETQIKLEVQEEGFLETMDGIQSFVPWPSVKTFTLFRDTLFIELTSRLWAIVPLNSVNLGSTAVDDLIRILRDRGIGESPVPQAVAAGLDD
jgi:hypothetical protein